MPRGNQLTRQWRLLQLLDRAGGITVDDAARDLGCVVRTIRRDLEVLQAAGFPVWDEPQGDGARSVWRVDDGFRRRLPLKLSLSEVAALVMSRHLLAPAGRAILDPALGAAFEKIGSVLSGDALALLARMHKVVGARAVGAKLQAPAADHLAAIQQALVERRSLRLRYYSMSADATTDRQVDPYHLTVFDGGFYLVARCHLRRDVRIFAVERIRELERLSARFEIPDDFDAAAYLAGAWGIIRGDVVPVRVRFAAPLARYLRERLWHPTQRFRTLDDGRVEMTLRVADTLEVRRFILGFGSEAEVVEPAALREALRRDAEALARKLAPERIPVTPSAPAAGRAPRRARRPIA